MRDGLARLRYRKLALGLQTRTGRRVLVRQRLAPSVELLPLIKVLRDVDNVIDIGANSGQFTLLVLLKLKPKRVVAFEPLSGPAQRFAAALCEDPRVTLHRTAIGPDRTVAAMHVAGKDDSSSLLEITDLQEASFPGTHEVATEAVDVAPLSDFLDESDLVGSTLLKVDVQGYEYEALRGCESLLPSVQFVLIELSFVELYRSQVGATAVTEFLMARGFSIRGVVGSSTIQADFLFARA